MNNEIKHKLSKIGLVTGDTRQKVVHFWNNYNASIIPEWLNPKHMFEVAVIHNGELDYSTNITNDVLRCLNKRQMIKAINKIKRLKLKD